MRRIYKIALTGLVTALAFPSGAALAQAARPSSFAMCGACHSVKAGENRLGPTLAGVSGRRPGAVAGFKYSAAMKAKGGKWTDAELDKFLANPRAALPGTTMAFAGQKDAAKRAELVAYLKTLK